MRHFIVHIMPFQMHAVAIASILILTFFSVAPIFLLNIWSQRKIYKPYPHPYITSALIWFVVFVLLEII